MTQEGATSGSSVQAMNAINAATGTTIATGSKQTAAMGASSLTLNQTGTTASSVQAANYAKADLIGGGAAFTQEHTGAGDVTLSQDATGAGSNVQAVNAAVGISDVTNLKQSVESSANLIVNQTTATASNVQAVNTVSTAVGTPTMTEVDQDINTTTTFALTQSGAVSNVQAGNNADAGTNAMGAVNQTITSADLTLDQNGGATGTQAGNRAVAGAVTDLDQSFASSGTAVTLKQGVTSVAGDSALQAANMLTASGAIAAVNQSFGDNGDTLTMNQAGATGVNMLQAGNLIDTSGGGSITATGSTQVVLADELDMDQTASTSLQGANVLITGGGDGELAQSATVTTLSMNQTGTAGSHQAANYAGSKL